jgi:hypothetical protein
MPKLENIHLGFSPLTERVYMGTQMKDGKTWKDKIDVTQEFLAMLFHWCPPGYQITMSRNIEGKEEKYYRVSVMEITKEEFDKNNEDADKKIH